MKSYENLPDSDLFRLMRAGDEAAFATLYRANHAKIYRFTLQMSGSKTLAEDVTQEVFLLLIRGAENFDSARGSLSSFLYGVARNHLLQRLRRERFYVPMESAGAEDPFESATASQDLSRIEAIESVRKAVLSLPERYREVVVLCDLEELSYAECAEILDCAVGTVRSRLHRARALLIDKLRPADSEESASEVKTARCFA